ncbi:MAG: hypothetical protein O3A78_02370 [Nitrospinae bacterium]|nr:hypothetical protein [Nitrospinota bacterium]MDA1108652.1 hypothetical protein [Nitrospinota bacterium]
MELEIGDSQVKAGAVESRVEFQGLFEGGYGLFLLPLISEGQALG